MTLDWKGALRRIDEMGLRERVMLFLTVSLVVAALGYVFFMDPALKRQKSSVERTNRDESQLKAVRAQLEQMAREEKGRSQLPEEAAVRELEKRLADAEIELTRRQRAYVAPEQLPALLRELVGRGERVRLEALRLLPGTPVQAQPAGAPGAAPRQLYRHGVQLTIMGSYFDLLGYLADLEKLPQRLIWGRLELQVERYPEVQLNLVLHTVSRQQSLLTM